jgi:hydroxypyruvate isomerase
MKFAANLGFLFVRESPNLVDRIKLAGATGFRGVEFPYPYDVPASSLAAVNKDAGVEQVLINSWPGNREAGELGIAVDPARRTEFREKLELSAVYLKVQRLKTTIIGLSL